MSRTRCSVQRCSAEPGPLRTHEFLTAQALRRNTPLRGVLHRVRGKKAYGSLS